MAPLIAKVRFECTPGMGPLTGRIDLDSGSPITGYVVTPFQDGYMLPSVTFRSAATSERVTGLTNGLPYTFMVAATNAVGTASDSYNASTPVTPEAYLPFSSDGALIDRVYLDLAGRAPTAGELSTASAGLDDGTLTQGALAASVMSAAPVAAVLQPVTRLYHDCVAVVPDRAGLLSYLHSRRAGASLQSLSNTCVKSSGFHKRYDGLSNEAFVKQVHRGVGTRRQQLRRRPLDGRPLEAQADARAGHRGNR
jgi:hypothetical protein